MIGCIVQARMSSSRLPGKVLKNIENNVTVLQSVLNQLKFSQYIEKIVVATSTNQEDDEIEEKTAKKNKKYDPFEGMSKAERQQKVKEENKERRQNKKMTKTHKKAIIKKTTHKKH